MKVVFRGIYSEILKMKHTFLFPFHAAIPIFVSTVFLMYYRLASWSEVNEISAYIEIIGVSLPFVISIICAANTGLEEQNHFQIFLSGYVKKWKEIVVKLLVLLGMGFISIFTAVVLFGMGYNKIIGKGGISLSMYMCIALLLFLGSIPVYLEHLCINLAFSGTISQCIGVAQSLLSALFLTGLGDIRWKFFPCTWSARGSLLFVNGLFQGKIESIFFNEIKKSALIFVLFMVIMCVIIGVWFHFYEGRQCSD